MGMIDDEQFSAALGRQIRVELAERAMTQQDLANAVPLEPATLNRYVQGRRDMPLPVFRRVASLLGLSAAELMGRIEGRAARAAQTAP